ncbi:MAG: glycosyltransferase family 2 protein [Elusimicrobiota bacterium]
MKISGFTFVKDAIKYDFPIVESIKSMLPLCDEVFVNVGISDDGSLEAVRSIQDDKITIIETEWDPKFKVKGRILAVQTNIPLYKCRGDWCIYLQADEVLHEEDHSRIRKSMEENLEDDRVEGLLLDYYHFFGSYDTYVSSYHWYRKEIRIIKNHLGIQSWRSAQTFRVDGRKLAVKQCPAHVYHYGWVRDPYKMADKNRYHDSLHHGDENSETEKEDRFYYEEHIDSNMVGGFRGTHSSVMRDRIENWKYKFEPKKHKRKITLKDIRYRITDIIDNLTGIKIGEYRNYKLIRD